MLPEELERGPLVHAAQVMSRPAIAVRDDASAAEAWRTLRNRHIRQAPVLDGADNLVGIVSERDLLTAIGEDDRLLGFVSRSDVLRAVIQDPPLSLWR